MIIPQKYSVCIKIFKKSVCWMEGVMTSTNRAFGVEKDMGKLPIHCKWFKVGLFIKYCNSEQKWRGPSGQSGHREIFGWKPKIRDYMPPIPKPTMLACHAPNFTFIPTSGPLSITLFP